MSYIYYKTALDETSVHECPNSEDWDIDTFAAAACADDYHANHDGWEATWPLDLYLAETEEATTWTKMVTHGIKRKETYHKKCQNAHAYTIRENRRKKHEPAL